MRKVFSSLLVLILGGAPAYSQPSDKKVGGHGQDVVTLADRLQDMPTEVERFLSLHEELSQNGWNVEDELPSSETEGVLREKVLNLPQGAKIEARLVSGERVRGRLMGSGNDGVVLAVGQEMIDGRWHETDRGEHYFAYTTVGTLGAMESTTSS